MSDTPTTRSELDQELTGLRFRLQELEARREDLDSIDERSSPRRPESVRVQFVSEFQQLVRRRPVLGAAVEQVQVNSFGACDFVLPVGPVVFRANRVPEARPREKLTVGQRGPFCCCRRSEGGQAPVA